MGRPSLTATETIMDVMTRFSAAEPEHVMVVWTDEKGCITLLSNCGHALIIGMSEFCKQSAINAIFRDDDE